MKIGKCEQLKKDMLMAIVDSIFLVEPLPNTQSDFEQRLAEGNKRLMMITNDYARQLESVLKVYNTLSQKRSKCATSEMKQHLKHLIYEGFVKEISLSQLKHIPRYLKAVQLRLDRREHDPQKDSRKAAQLAPLWEAYWQRRAEGNSSKLMEFRWMLEELRVSLFAQELKTAYPVSVQRLEKFWVGV